MYETNVPDRKTIHSMQVARMMSNIGLVLANSSHWQRSKGLWQWQIDWVCNEVISNQLHYYLKWHPTLPKDGIIIV